MLSQRDQKVMMFKLVLYTDKYKVWFIHDGEEPIERIPSYPDYRQMTVQDIVRERGDNSITHLCMQSLTNLPEWLSDVAPDLTQLKLEYIDEKSPSDGTFNWQR